MRDLSKSSLWSNRERNRYYYGVYTSIGERGVYYGNNAVGYVSVHSSGGNDEDYVYSYLSGRVGNGETGVLFHF